MHRTRIKICGIRTPDAALAAVESGADAIGFVFVPGTPRAIDPEEAAGIMFALPPMVTTVGVFADVSVDRFTEVEESCPTTLVQFSGDEPEVRVRQCGPNMIKGVRFQAATIARDLRRWDSVDEVDAILVDGSSGGQGVTFDWRLLVPAMEGVQKPILIAGGLTPANVGEAIRAIRPYAVDVSSGVERDRGVKDAGLIRDFCRAVREADAALTG